MPVHETEKPDVTDPLVFSADGVATCSLLCTKLIWYQVVTVLGAMGGVESQYPEMVA